MKKIFTLLAVIALAVTSAFAETIKVDFSQFGDGVDAKGATPIEANGFYIVGNNSKVILDKNGYYTGGSSTSTARHIYYTPSVNGTLTVEAHPSGDSSDRYIAIAASAVAPKADGSNVLEKTMMPKKGPRVKVSYDLTANKTYYIVMYGNGTFSAITYEATGAPAKEESQFELTATSRLLSPGQQHSITYEDAAGAVTYKSNNEQIATVDDEGLVTAVSGGQTTISVTDAGSSTVKGKTVSFTVCVPYDAKDLATYVLSSDTYGFSYEKADGVYYFFKNGFVIANAKNKAYGTASLSTSLKYSANVPYTILVPQGVTVYSAKLVARNNYTSDKNQAFWGTIFGQDCKTEALPWATEDAVVKTMTLAQPGTSENNLVFTPTGNQVQMIIELYSSKPSMPVGDEVTAFYNWFLKCANALGQREEFADRDLGAEYEATAQPIVADYIDGNYDGRIQVAKDDLADAFLALFAGSSLESLAKMYVAQAKGENISTAISNVATGASRTGKFVQNGRVVIVKNGKTFTTTGALLK